VNRYEYNWIKHS